MSNLHTKNVIYAGLLSGLALSLLCLLTPAATGVVVYQLLIALVVSAAVGFLFRNKIRHPFAVTSFGMLYALSSTRYLLFPDTTTPLLLTICLVLATVMFFLFGSKFFVLKMNKILQYVIAIFGFIVLFFAIPLLLLLQARAMYILQ